MSVAEMDECISKNHGKELFGEYPWFYANIYENLKTTIKDFFQKEYEFRFIGVSYDDENVLFFGDEYFVNKIQINKSTDVIIRISSSLISSILDNTLGACDSAFSIDSLTDLEAMLIKSYTSFIYNKLSGLLIKTEQNKKVIKSAKIYNFTFYVEYNNHHTGKIIISLPDYMLKAKIKLRQEKECFDVSCFNNLPAVVTLRIGSARISLSEIKSIESGDVIMLDDSDVNKMSLLWEENVVKFNITPNPALIISVDNSGGNEMDSESVKNNNMWDTILVDVVAEFDNFKMTLGELKQVSEGLVIDVGSVYKNKVKLRVAKQVIASGELVILNDRYGVRIDTVKNNNETESEEMYSDEQDEQEKHIEQNISSNTEDNQDEEEQENSEQKDDENFDYSDFEIEDESI